MTSSTIYYLCYLPAISGGELVNVQSVETLHRHGIRALALVNGDTNLRDIPENMIFPIERITANLRFKPDDILVIPEINRRAFAYFSHQPCRRVIHTQGPFLTFRGFDSIEEMNAAGLSAGIACSHFGRDFMLRMGSTLSWQVVTPQVLSAFHLGGSLKQLQVAYMPDKRPKEAPVVMALFRKKYPQLSNIPWVPISGVSRQACAAIMADSAVFASFSYLEGLGLPPLEAMSCGCLVCGFDGHGGSDYARPENGLWIKEGDYEGFADAVAATLISAMSVDGNMKRQIDSGYKTAALYSQQRFERELINAWKAITGDHWTTYLIDDANTSTCISL